MNGPKNEKDDVERTAEALAAATGVGLATTMAEGTLSSGVTAGLATFLTAMGGRVLDAFRTRNQRRVEKWWKALLAASDGEPERVAAEIEKRLDDPNTQDVVFEALRSLLEEFDEAATPALGALTAEYIQSGQKPDRFFRGVARVLVEVTAEELEDLRSLATAIDRLPPGPERLEINAIPIGDTRVWMACLADEEGRQKMGGLCAVSHWRSLFHLLKTHALAEDNPGGFSDTISGPQVLVIQRSIAARLRTILGEAPGRPATAP